MRKLINNKTGSTLIEVVIAVALFTLVAGIATSAMVSSAKVTEEGYKKRPVYESSVGNMDETLMSAPAADVGEDVTVDVEFPSGNTKQIDSKIIVSNNFGGIGVVKMKN